MNNLEKLYDELIELCQITGEIRSIKFQLSFMRQDENLPTNAGEWKDWMGRRLGFRQLLSMKLEWQQKIQTRIQDIIDRSDLDKGRLNDAPVIVVTEGRTWKCSLDSIDTNDSFKHYYKVEELLD